jgi:hypothetical protein
MFKLMIYSTIFFFVEMVIFINGPHVLLNQTHYFNLYIDLIFKSIFLLIFLYIILKNINTKNIFLISFYITIGLITSNIIHNIFFEIYVNNGNTIKEILLGIIIGSIIYYIFILGFTFLFSHSLPKRDTQTKQ